MTVNKLNTSPVIIIMNCSCMLIFCYSFTESLGKNVFTVDVNQAANNARTRAMVQILDRHDGSYLVRYRLMQGYHDVVINVLHNGRHVAGSPYALPGISYRLCRSQLVIFSS